MSRAAYLVSNTAPIDLAAVRTAMPPPEVLAWCDGDGAGDYQPLWALTCALAPRTIVELGTRDARSTRVVAHAAPQAALTTIDIADCSAVVPAGATFVHADAASAFGAWRDPIDLLFVDTDPHSALQTTGWLNTWVARFARAAAWHDSLTTPVGAALVTWLAHHPEWSGAELGTNHGMYLMWRHTP